MFFSIFVLSNGQITYQPNVRSQNSKVMVESVELSDESTIIHVKVPKGLGGWGGWIRFSSYTYIEDRKSQFSSCIKSLGDHRLDTEYKTKYKNCPDSISFYLYFDRLPYGCEEFDLIEHSEDGFEWNGITIINPYPSVPHMDMNKSTAQEIIDSQNEAIGGIYDCITTEKNKHRLACIKDKESYKLVVIDSIGTLPYWHVGDVKAILEPSASDNLFKAIWYMQNKTQSNNCFITFGRTNMSVLLDAKEYNYLKMYPKASNEIDDKAHFKEEWSGTGFALKNGFVVTNYHVVEGAKHITIQGMEAPNKSFDAIVIGTDKINDLALLKINDSSFRGFSGIPYSISNEISEVGEEIFVLGYPLTSTMGEEIKLTTGVISSRTGFQGDVTNYQISAPIQPGNSGGPMFDDKGNLVGIVCAKYKGAENVGYAIKPSYLFNLIESAANLNIVPKGTELKGLSLKNQVKLIRDYIFLII